MTERDTADQRRERGNRHREETATGGTTSRRAVLGAVTAGVAALAGCGDDGSGTGTQGPPRGDGQGPGGGSQHADGTSWMAGVDNYDGYERHMGEPMVTVRVGTAGNGGHHAFSPAAVMVSPGTRVVWRWTGRGDTHGVSARDGSFESDRSDGSTDAFARTFDSPGVYRYYCPVHRDDGMRGAVLVT